MTRRLQTVLYDGPVSYDHESFFGGDALDVTQLRRQEIPALEKLHRRLSRDVRLRLKPDARGKYAVDDHASYRQGVRGGLIVRQWAAIELFCDFDDVDTFVRCRLHNGSISLWWNGVAWAAAGANDWNTPDQVVERFSSLSGTTYRKIGVEWDLWTLNQDLTPLVYGYVIAARLQFGSRAGGNTVATTSSDSWQDDLIHRVLIPELRAALSPERSIQRPAAGAAVTSINLAGDRAIGDSHYVVKTVQDVYDLTLDPSMLSPLAGTWNPATKIWTPTTPIPATSAYLIRVVHTPTVIYQAGRDLLTETVPSVVIETLSVASKRELPGTHIVRNIAALTALSVPAPHLVTYAATIRFESDAVLSTMEMHESLIRMLNGAEGRAFISESTGMVVALGGMSPQRIARGNDPIASSSRIDVKLTTTQYLGAETLTHLVPPDGVKVEMVVRGE